MEGLQVICMLIFILAFLPQACANVPKFALVALALIVLFLPWIPFTYFHEHRYPPIYQVPAMLLALGLDGDMIYRSICWYKRNQAWKKSQINGSAPPTD